jgi:hypothetical protein
MALQNQVRKLKPVAHVFGHSHIRINEVLSDYKCSDGGISATRFVQSYLGEVNSDGTCATNYVRQVWPAQSP